MIEGRSGPFPKSCFGNESLSRPSSPARRDQRALPLNNGVWKTSSKGAHFKPRLRVAADNLYERSALQLGNDERLRELAERTGAQLPACMRRDHQAGGGDDDVPRQLGT